MTRINGSKHDARGKAHEIMLAWALSGNTWPNHFRSEESSPSEIYNVCVNTLGIEACDLISEHSYSLSEHIKSALHVDGHLCNTTDVQSVTWTSLDDSLGSIGEHEKLTGIKDINSDADLMIQTISTGNFIGISAKYGTSKHATLRNSGCSTLEEKLKIDYLNSFRKQHDKYIKQLGFNGTAKENHDRYKSLKGTDIAKKAEQSSLAYRRNIAQAIRNSLENSSSDFIKNIIIEASCHDTVFPHYRTHVRVHPAGALFDVYNIERKTKEASEKYENFRVHNNSNSININFLAFNKKFQVEEIVATLSIRTNSGPVTNWRGDFKVQMLNERKRKKRVLYIFDMDDTLFWYKEGTEPSVHVIDKSGAVVHKLSTKEYHDHELMNDHSFSYETFKDSEHFFGNALPIQKMIDRMLKLSNDGKDVIIVTARTDFTDHDIFLKKLNEYNIDANKIHIHRSGNIKLNNETTEENKKRVIKDLVVNGSYDEVQMWDDRVENLEILKDLNAELKIKTVLRHVDYDGNRNVLKIRII